MRKKHYGHSRTMTAERFWSQVLKPDEGCWPWLGRVNKAGYGKVGYRWRKIHASRMAWIFAEGDPGVGLFVCHHCDNPICCRPSHLFVGTPKDNMRDMIAKGRQYIGLRHTGEKHHMVKLTDTQVEEIRALYAAGNHTQQEIAKIYSTTQSLVSSLVRRASRAQGTR